MKPYKRCNPVYQTKTWKIMRNEALTRDGGLCQDCVERVQSGRGGKVRRATLVHHIIPVEERPELAYDLGNLRSLCNICHNQRHPEKGQRQQDRSSIHIRIEKI